MIISNNNNFAIKSTQNLRNVDGKQINAKLLHKQYIRTSTNSKTITYLK